MSTLGTPLLLSVRLMAGAEVLGKKMGSIVPLDLRRPAGRERREHAWRGAEQLPGFWAEDREVALVRGAQARGDQGAIFGAVPRVVGGEVGKEVGGGLAGALGGRGLRFHSAGSSKGAVTK